MRKFIALVEAAEAGHGIPGLPADVQVPDRQLLAMARRPAFRLHAEPGKDEDEWRIHVHPADPEGVARSFKPREHRDRLAYYDPAYADIHTHDEDDPYLRFHMAHPKPHLTRDFVPEGMPADAIYRGMSAEEFEAFQRSGEVWSHGEYNIGSSQNGLTYWTTEPDSAASYANGFAPSQYKPTFSHPAYIVAARHPGPEHTRRVTGTGSHEVGVSRPILRDEVIGIWRGRVIAFDAGDFTLRQDWSGWRMGAGTSPRADVVWERIG